MHRRDAGGPCVRQRNQIYDLELVMKGPRAAFGLPFNERSRPETADLQVICRRSRMLQDIEGLY
jgi:hypothetical protein